MSTLPLESRSGDFAATLQDCDSAGLLAVVPQLFASVQVLDCVLLMQAVKPLQVQVSWQEKDTVETSISLQYVDLIISDSNLTYLPSFSVRSSSFQPVTSLFAIDKVPREFPQSARLSETNTPVIVAGALALKLLVPRPQL